MGAFVSTKNTFKKKNLYAAVWFAVSYISQNACGPSRKFRLHDSYKAACQAAERDQRGAGGEPAAAAMGRARTNVRSRRNFG